mgnify:CR=1 FL=1
MKVLLTTTMALGVVFMLGAGESVNAAVPAYNQYQLAPAGWHGHHHGYYGHGYYYVPAPSYYWGPGYGYRPNYPEPPLLQMGPVRIF